MQTQDLYKNFKYVIGDKLVHCETALSFKRKERRKAPDRRKGDRRAATS